MDIKKLKRPPGSHVARNTIVYSVHAGYFVKLSDEHAVPPQPGPAYGGRGNTPGEYPVQWLDDEGRYTDKTDTNATTNASQERAAAIWDDLPEE